MDNAAIAHALFNAVDAGDFEGFTSLFAPGAVIWHNYDQTEVSIPDTAAVLKGLKSLVKSAAYGDRRYMSVPGGAVAQHVLRVTTLDGQLVEMPVMLRMFIEGGMIQRIEEYFDTGQSGKMVPH